MESSELLDGIGKSLDAPPSPPSRRWTDTPSPLRRWKSIVRRIGDRYAECRLDNFVEDVDEQRVVCTQLEQYIADLTSNVDSGRSIVLFGPCGVGKDHLLVGMMHAALTAGVDVDWRNGEELYQRFRDAMDDGTPERHLFAELVDLDVLALSDPIPPWGSLSEWQARVLFLVLDKRYRANRPTWVTLNVASGKEASQRMTAQVVDRLRDRGLMLHCEWESFRKPEGA